MNTEQTEPELEAILVNTKKSRLLKTLLECWPGTAENADFWTAHLELALSGAGTDTAANKSR